MTGQMSHASNPRARKKAREGERRMHAERQQSGQPPMAPEQARARLEEIAPAISQETPRPAEALARQVGVDAQRCLQRALDPARSGHRDWKRIGYGYAIVHLLAVLRQQDPGIADAAAKVITAAWDGAGALLWYRRVKAGADPAEAFGALPTLPDYDCDLHDTANLAVRDAGIVYSLAWNLAWRNDEAYGGKSPEARYTAFLAWIDAELAEAPAA